MSSYVHVDMSQLGLTYVKMKQLETKYNAYGIGIVAGIAREARKIASDKFFDSTTGMLRYNSPLRALEGKPPLAMRGDQGFVDVRGYRLINYSLESKRPSKKRAYLSSYPMNLYEHATSNGRPGLYIMTAKLPPLVEGVVPKHVAKAEAEMAILAEEELNAD